MQCFYEATALDPRYALPARGARRRAFWWPASPAPCRRARPGPSPRESSRQALALDDGIPEPHVSAGFLRLFQDWDWAGAERELRRAVDLAPESTAPHQWLGLLLDLRGRRDEAQAGRSAARRRWTRCRWWSRPSPACTTRSAATTRPSSPRPRRTLELDPHQFLGHWAVGGALQNLGRHDEAVAEHRRALDLAEGSAFLKPVLARSLALAGHPDEARGLVAGLGDASPYQQATVQLALGDTARALELLVDGRRERDPWIVILAVDPMMRPLRGEPAFDALERRVCAP